MANEITITDSGAVVNGGYRDQLTFGGTYRVDQAAAGSAGGIRTIGTSAENLVLTDIATPGILYVKNLDATNFVEIGVDNTGFVAMAKLEPGDPPARFRIADSTTIQLKADTASCNVQFWCLES